MEQDIQVHRNVQRLEGEDISCLYTVYIDPNTLSTSARQHTTHR